MKKINTRGQYTDLKFSRKAATTQRSCLSTNRRDFAPLRDLLGKNDTLHIRKPGIVVFVLFAMSLMINSHRLIAQDQAAALAEAAKRHVVELADDKYEGRGAGYPGEEKAASYIADQFKKAGLKPGGDKSGKDRSYFQEFSFHAMHPVKPWEIFRSRNIIGFVEGSDPVLKNEIVVIGAHYDGQGRKGQADPMRFTSKDDDPNDEIWNSANDNITSVAVLIELANVIKDGDVKIKRSLLFIAFGAEEHGMTGSIWYVNHPSFPLKDHVAMINLEKLGLGTGKPFHTVGNANSPVWDEMIKAIQAHTPTKVMTTNPYVVPESDHYPFAASKIPAIMFYTSGIAAHNAGDHPDKIDFNRVIEAGRFVMQMLKELVDRPARPQYVPAPFADLGISAHLATDEEVNALGLKAPEGGLKVTGIIAGLPGAMGGLQPGDLIIEFGNTKFVRGESLESMQKKHMDLLMGKQGNKLKATVIRNGKTEVMEVNLR